MDPQTRPDLAHARDVAVAAAEAAGDLTVRAFGGEVGVEAKGADGDVVTAVDIAAETEIIGHLRGAFADLGLRSEEAGWVGPESAWWWSVDPLDGTNNYAVGMGVWGVAITLMHHDEPVIGVVHEPARGTTASAIRGQGGQVTEGVLALAEPRPLTGASISFVKGHTAAKDTSLLALKARLDASARRVLSLWAPAVGWAMLARGAIHGVVVVDSEGDDLWGGVVLAREAGAAIVDFDGHDVTRAHDRPHLVAAHPDQVDELLSVVNATGWPS